MSKEAIFKNSRSAISSPESEAGRSPCNSPDGPTIGPYGPDHAHVNHSARPEKGKEKKTSGIYGPSFDDSSPSASLQRSLESRLRARMDVNGSLEYVLTWKHWDMLSGPPICALRARARHISDSGCFGWRTPTANEKVRSLEFAKGREPGPQELAGWPTCQAHDATGGKTPEQVNAMRAKGHGVSNLNEVCQLSDWPTPNANERGPETAESKAARGRTGGIDMQSTAILTGTTPSSAETGSYAASPTLNPAFSRWLMEFPESWDRHSPGWGKWGFAQRELTGLAGYEGMGTR